MKNLVEKGIGVYKENEETFRPVLRSARRILDGIIEGEDSAVDHELSKYAEIAELDEAIADVDDEIQKRRDLVTFFSNIGLVVSIIAKGAIK